jgi:hypothetical protein
VGAERSGSGGQRCHGAGVRAGRGAIGQALQVLFLCFILWYTVSRCVASCVCREASERIQTSLGGSMQTMMAAQGADLDNLMTAMSKLEAEVASLRVNQPLHTRATHTHAHTSLQKKYLL